MSCIYPKSIRGLFGSDYYDNDLNGKTAPVLVTGTAVVPGEMTIHEFRRGVKRDKAHYADLKDDKYSTFGTVVLLQQLTCITRILS
jgi:hypothetical protein